MDENLEYYKKIADDRIKGWRDIDKNELFNLYIKHENDSYISGGYFAAILVKYWGLVNSKKMRSCGYATYDDCGNWLVDSVCTALRERKWKDISNKLYMDKRGPEKVVNKLMKVHLITHFQSIKKDKRKSNLNMESTDDLNEDFNFEVSDIDIKIEDADMWSIIHELCVSGDYLTAIVAHAICFDIPKTLTNINACEECVSYILSSDSMHLLKALNFTYTANATEEDVLKFKKIDRYTLKRKVQYSLYKLSKVMVK